MLTREGVYKIIYGLFFSVPVNSAEYIQKLRDCKITLWRFVSEVFLYMFFLPVIFAYAVLFLPINDVYHGGNIFEFWTFILVAFAGCISSGLIPIAYASVFLEHRDIPPGFKPLLMAAFLGVAICILLIISGYFLFPIPFSPMFLAVPTWMSFSYYILKSGRYLQPEVLKDPRIGQKTTMILLLGVYTAGGYYIYVLFNLLFYYFRGYEVAEYILVALYPGTRIGLRSIPVALIKGIAPDSTHDIHLVFELLGAIYYQILFVYIEDLNLFVVLTFFSVFEQLFDVIRLTKSWRNLRAAYKKKFIKPYEKKEGKEKKGLSDIKNPQEKSILSSKAYEEEKAGNLKGQPDEVAFPEICIHGADSPEASDNEAPSQGQQRASPLINVVAVSPPANSNKVAMESASKQDDAVPSMNTLNMAVSSKGTLDSVACSEHSGKSASGEHLEDDARNKLGEHPAPSISIEHVTASSHSVQQQRREEPSDTQVPLPPKINSAGNLDGHEGGSKRRQSLQVAQPASIHMALGQRLQIGESRNMQPSRDTLASVAASDKTPSVRRQEGNKQGEPQMTQFIMEDKFSGLKKKIPFELETYNWYICSSLAITMLVHLVTPPVFIILFSIIYFLPYNFTCYTIVEEIETASIIHSFQFSAIHAVIQLVLSALVSYYLYNKFGIDYKTPMAIMLKEKRRYVVFAATLVYAITYQVMYKAYGLDISFKFTWIIEKLHLS